MRGGASLALKLGLTPHVVGITVLLFPMLFTGKRLNRPEGLVLVACYGGYLFFMWPK